jgi:hypothetical protein
MQTVSPATHAPPVVALAAPLATAADIRAAINVLRDEAAAHDTLSGPQHASDAASLRRAIALLRACLHHADAGR